MESVCNHSHSGFVHDDDDAHLLRLNLGKESTPRYLQGDVTNGRITWVKPGFEPTNPAVRTSPPEMLVGDYQKH
jgi:hypothetical protein